MKVPFVAKVRKQNQSFVITIPKDVVEKGMVEIGEIPEFWLNKQEIVSQKPIQESNCQTNQTKTIYNSSGRGFYCTESKYVLFDIDRKIRIEIPKPFKTEPHSHNKKSPFYVPISDQRKLGVIRGDLKFIYFRGYLMEVNKQITIKLNCKYQKIINELKREWFDLLTSNSEIAGACIFKCWLYKRKKIKEDKTIQDIIVESIGLDKEMFSLQLLAEFKKFHNRK